MRTAQPCCIPTVPDELLMTTLIYHHRKNAKAAKLSTGSHCFLCEIYLPAYQTHTHTHTTISINYMCLVNKPNNVSTQVHTNNNVKFHKDKDYVTVQIIANYTRQNPY